MLKVLTALRLCRTPALGHHWQVCCDCGREQGGVRFNSCRDRHCPLCSGPARARWLDRVRQSLLPVPYFQAVFTLPEELRLLAAARPKVVYNTLFHAVRDTLSEVAATPRHLGARIGMLLVLHTWTQELHRHPHIHVVIPAGGLSPDGEQWIAGRDRWFLPQAVLGRVFRGKFLAELRAACVSGSLRLSGPLEPLNSAAGFDRWRSTLPGPAWNVYIEPPPASAGDDPDHLLKYLARYVAGTAISNQRLVSLENGVVTFTVKNRDSGRTEFRRLPGAEFVRRFVSHILPSGLHRIRFAGLWANRRRRERLEHCRALIAAAKGQTTTAATSEPAAAPETAPPSPTEPIPSRGVVTRPATAPPPLQRSSSSKGSNTSATGTAAPPPPIGTCKHCGSTRLKVGMTHPPEGLYDQSARLYGHLMGGHPPRPPDTISSS